MSNPVFIFIFTRTGCLLIGKVFVIFSIERKNEAIRRELNKFFQVIIVKDIDNNRKKFTIRKQI